MKRKPTLSDRAHATHATTVDLDDPFLGRRLGSRTGRSADFSGTRRIPAPIEERFHLIRTRKTA